MAENKVTKINEGITNKEFLEAIRNEIPSDFLRKITDSKGDFKSNEEIAKVITNMPDLANQFIGTLVNRNVKTLFYNRKWENKLAVLQKGDLKLGTGIQQVFVNLGKRVGFGEHFERRQGGEGSSENDVLGAVVPEVDVNYIAVNGRYKYKVTVSVDQLQEAFINENGLATLVNNIIAQNEETAEYDNYVDMYNMLFATEEMTKKEGTKYGKSLLLRMNEVIATKPDMMIRLSDDLPKTLVTEVRTMVGNLKFKSKKYNLNDVFTHTPSENLVFLTDPRTIANIDVNVLAQAFNVSSTDIKSRTITVHELPTIEGKKIRGLLMDEEVLQFWYKLNSVSKFNNPDTLEQSYWLHQWVINGLCLFANAVAFYTE